MLLGRGIAVTLAPIEFPSQMANNTWTVDRGQVSASPCGSAAMLQSTPNAALARVKPIQACLRTCTRCSVLPHAFRHMWALSGESRQRLQLPE
eukprot:8684687-Alexandrium_andersonii.AAC.1